MVNFIIYLDYFEICMNNYNFLSIIVKGNCFWLF